MLPRRPRDSMGWPALLLLALAGCRPAGSPLFRATPAAPRTHELGLPAAAGSGEAQLAAAPDGRMLASWLEPAGKAAHALRFSVLEGDAWSEPRTIAAGADLFVNFADFPSVAALPGGTLWAHWLAKRGAPGAYDVRLSASLDGGRTWNRPLSPHRDGTLAEHGFVSLLPAGAGLALVWLDGRKYTATQAGHGGAGETMLMYTVVGPDGAPGEEVVLDERACDCCQTAAVRTARGLLVAYRDRSAAEVRDIAVVRHEGGRWSAPRRVAADEWNIAGCPVNGPALAADGERAAVAWYTGAPAPRVSVAFSGDAGTTFGKPIVVDDGRPLGRVDVVLLDGGDVLVSWLEQAAQGAELRLRRVASDGTRGTAVRVADLSAARSSGFPRLERAGRRVVLAWRDSMEPPHLHTARVEP